MTNNRSPLRILKFSPGTLYFDFSEGIKFPGIYGTILNPTELLDILMIKERKNENGVRFAGQFSLNQEEMDKRIEEGLKVGLTKRLELYWIFPSALPHFEDARRESICKVIKKF